MEKHEGLATAAYGAGLALAAVAAGGVVSSLAGGAGAGAAGGLLGRIGGGLVAAGTGAVGTAGLAVAGGAAGGYLIGTGISGMLEGTSASDAIGEKIAQALALFGNDTAQAAIETNAKYDQMIAEQQQTKAKQDQMVNEQAQTKQIQAQMSTQLGIMTAHLSNIAAKPVPTFNPNITIAGRPVAMNMMDEIGKQSKRGKYGPYK